MTRAEEYAWAAGLFEGEGCFSWNVQRNGRKHPAISLKSTDEDVVRRFGRIMQCGSVTGPQLREGRKPIWTWRVTGIDALYHLELTIGPHLRERRTEKMHELLMFKRKRHRNGEWIERGAAYADI